MDRLDKIKEFLENISKECDKHNYCIRCNARDKCEMIDGSVDDLLTNILEIEKHLEGEANE